MVLSTSPFRSHRERTSARWILNKLRFWLGNDDNYTRDQLYLWFCEYLQGADLTVGEQHIRLPEFMLKAVGFEPQDAMLPWPKNVHSGYRILQEYFCYPDAFLFFDLCGCPALPDGLQAEFFTLQLRFRALCPWTSGCAAIPCACIAHLPLIYLSTMQKPSRWTTGGQTIRWFPAAITHNITMYFPLTVW